MARVRWYAIEQLKTSSDSAINARLIAEPEEAVIAVRAALAAPPGDSDLASGVLA